MYMIQYFVLDPTHLCEAGAKQTLNRTRHSDGTKDNTVVRKCTTNLSSKLTLKLVWCCLKELERITTNTLYILCVSRSIQLCFLFMLFYYSIYNTLYSDKVRVETCWRQLV